MSEQGRKPAAKLAEKEDNLAEMKVKFSKGELTGDQYYKAARPLEKEIRKLRAEPLGGD